MFARSHWPWQGAGFLVRTLREAWGLAKGSQPSWQWLSFRGFAIHMHYGFDLTSRSLMTIVSLSWAWFGWPIRLENTKTKKNGFISLIWIYMMVSYMMVSFEGPFCMRVRLRLFPKSGPQIACQRKERRQLRELIELCTCMCMFFIIAFKSWGRKD